MNVRRLLGGCAVVLVAGCGADAPAPSSMDGGADPQRPPRGGALVEEWLRAGHYRSWRCEPEIMSARSGGPHGRNRVCSNDLLAAAAAGPFPVGAASVKELYGAGSTLAGHAVALKVKSGSGADTWYWYERVGTTIHADGASVGLCTGCHTQAPDDHVYVRVPLRRP